MSTKRFVKENKFNNDKVKVDPDANMIDTGSIYNQFSASDIHFLLVNLHFWLLTIFSSEIQPAHTGKSTQCNIHLYLIKGFSFY